MKKIIITIFSLAATMLLLGSQASAYQIQDLPGTEVKGDIVLGPTKIEAFLNPGEKTTKEITVTNRTGSTLSFTIGMEDFKGSRDADQSVIFLGPEKGPYSLRDWLKPELSEFTLEHGQRIHLPVEISVPLDADPGGHYGVVFASMKPAASQSGSGEPVSQVSIVSRAGTLFFVRINGEIEEIGQLKSIETQKKLYEKGPIPFQVFFENNGSVHLTPYGTIEIKNMMGKKVDSIELDPWFVMPDSLRMREASWNKEFLFGKYVAIVKVNRGYGDIIDQKSTEFWVIPWKIVLAGLIAIVLLVYFFYWMMSKFEIKRKDQTVPKI